MRNAGGNSALCVQSPCVICRCVDVRDHASCDGSPDGDSGTGDRGHFWLQLSLYDTIRAAHLGVLYCCYLCCASVQAPSEAAFDSADGPSIEAKCCTRVIAHVRFHACDASAAGAGGGWAMQAGRPPQQPACDGHAGFPYSGYRKRYS